MTSPSALLSGLAGDARALLLTAFGVGAETDPTLLTHLAEPLRGSLERRARALLDLPGARRVRFAVDRLRRDLADGDPAGHLARLRDGSAEGPVDGRLTRASGAPSELVLALARLDRRTAERAGGDHG